MAEMDDREALLKQDVLLVATAGLSLLNGMPSSPLMGYGLPIGPVGTLLRPFFAGTLLGTPLIFNYLTSLFCSLITLLTAGVAAAIYERATGLQQSNSVSLGIWLAATFALTLPALLNMAGVR